MKFVYLLIFLTLTSQVLSVGFTDSAVLANSLQADECSIYAYI